MVELFGRLIILPLGVKTIISEENKFSLKPIYSKYNAYLIVEADKMNNNAANKLYNLIMSEINF